MLTLLLLRHAKAIPQAGDDSGRVLTEGGHADAARLGAFLLEKDLLPDRALVSVAARTRQTMEGLARTADRIVPTTFDPALYNATERQIRDRVSKVVGSAILLVVGHNPGIAELALALAASGDPQDFGAMRARFPPCSLAVITFDHHEWSDVRHGGGRLDAFVTPDYLIGR